MSPKYAFLNLVSGTRITVPIIKRGSMVTGKGSRQRLGFTLVEMLMVIIVVAVISAIAIPKVTKQIQLAKERSLRAQLRIARIAVERFYNDTGYYPQRMSRLNDLKVDVTPTFPALTPGGIEQNLPASLYRGPYISDDSGNKRFTSQPNPKGGTFTHAAMKIIFDPTLIISNSGLRSFRTNICFVLVFETHLYVTLTLKLKSPGFV